MLKTIWKDKTKYMLQNTRNNPYWLNSQFSNCLQNHMATCSFTQRGPDAPRISKAPLQYFKYVKTPGFVSFR